MFEGFRIEARLGTFADVTALAADQAATLRAVREAVATLHPDATETASRRERSVWWGWGPRKMTDGYAYAMPHAAHVNLGFFHGAALPDPESLLGGTGKALRHVKLRAPEEARRPAILELLSAARDERRRALTNA